MKSKIKFILPIYAALLPIVILGVYLRTVKASSTAVNPLGDEFSVLSSSIDFDSTHNQRLVYGFLPYWQLHKTKFIHLDKLTDLAFFALEIEKSGNIKKFSDDGTLDPGYNQWRNSETLNKLILDAKDNNVRVSLTVISHVDEKSDYFLSCNSCWATFVEDVIEEMEYHDIKDLNLDFEYVGYTTKDNAIKYSEFAGYVNDSLDEHFGDSFLVVSSFADSAVKPRITDVETLAPEVDALFIMAYDFHYSGSENAGPVSPINGKDVTTEYDISTMLRDYTANIPPSKLILGVPYYGYNWVTYPADSYATRIPGNDYIGYSQSQTYEFVMETILNYRPTIQWDSLGQVPYFNYYSSETGSHRQVYFENVRSLALKYNLVKQNGLGGVGIWALGYDGGYQELWELLHQEFPRY